MTIIDRQQASPEESFPGIDRWTYVNDPMGADSLTVMELEMSDGSVVPTHTHPTEEAMVVMEGELEALVGDTVENVGPGRTVLAPAGVKHGLTNRSGASSRVMAVFPTSKVVRDFVD